MNETGVIASVLREIRDELKHKNKHDETPDPQLEKLFSYLDNLQKRLDVLWAEREERRMIIEQQAMPKQ